MKTCSKCHKTKPLSTFYKHATCKAGRCSQCKSCTKEYRLQNREQRCIQKKLYYQQNKQACLNRNKINAYNNWERHMLKSTKEHALKFNREHTIVITDIVIPDKCPYLNVPLTREIGSGYMETNASIDRIDSTKGYTPDNIQVISRLANTIKNNATTAQLSTFARNILKIHT